MKTLFLAAPLSAALAMVATPASAQDIHPVLDLPTLAQGQVISSTAKNQGRRWARSRGPTAKQIAGCAQRPRFRRELSPDDPRLHKLEGLCRNLSL